MFAQRLLLHKPTDQLADLFQKSLVDPRFITAAGLKVVDGCHYLLDYDACFFWIMSEIRVIHFRQDNQCFEMGFIAAAEDNFLQVGDVLVKSEQ